MSDVDKLKERHRQTWGLGDYTVLARSLEPAATALLDACAVSAGQEVLDVAAGNGNFALACAREGASVVASDLAPGMIELGRARSEAEGVDIEWVEADVESLPFEDERFDCAGSVFGAFLAPRPEVAAAEMFRVVRPGGAVGLTAWIPDRFFGSLQAVMQKYLTIPEGIPLPQEWGDEETARARLDGLAGHVEFERTSLTLTADSPEAYATEFAEVAPTGAAARERLDEEEFEQLLGDLAQLARDWNTTGGDGVAIEAEYLVIAARKRG